LNPSWKIIVVGSAGVGKTSLVLRYVTGRYPMTHPVTLSFPIDSKTVDTDDVQATLQIWDTGPYQEREAVPGGYYVATRGVVLVYDMTRRDTFESVLPWKRTVDAHLAVGQSEHGYPCVLVANKSDLTDQRQVTTEDGLKLAEVLGAEYVEASAKLNTNVSHIFQAIAEAIVKLEAAVSDAYDWFRVRDPKTGMTHHAYRRKRANEYLTECGTTVTAFVEKDTRQRGEASWAIVDRKIGITCDRCLRFLSMHGPIDKPPDASNL